MKNLVISACLPGLLLWGNSAISQTFVESAGFVSFEAEAGAVNGDWVRSTDLGHFSGDSYIVWNGPNFFNKASAGQGTISYQFEITTPGNYEMRWRSRIAHGHSNTESNDTWVRFPSGVNVAGEEPLFGWTKVHMGHVGAWYWDAKTNDHTGVNVRQWFPAGLHTLEISGRSSGHAIDKLALFKYDQLTLSPNDLDSRSGTPQASVDGNAVALNRADSSAATVVPAGVNYTPGECLDDTLALPAIADILFSEGSVFNQGPLNFAPQPARAFLRFDTRAVTNIESAALEITVVDGEGDAEIEYALLDSAVWEEIDITLDPAPQSVLQLATAGRRWVSGTRYSVELPAADLQSGLPGLSITALSSNAWLSMAPREDSLQMPLLLLRGSGDFCANYRAAVAASNPESNEVASNPEQDPVPQTAPLEPTETASEPVSTEGVVPTAIVEPVDSTPNQASPTEATSNSDASDPTVDPRPVESVAPLVNPSSDKTAQGGSGGGSFGLLFLCSLLTGGIIRRVKGGRYT